MKKTAIIITALILIPALVFIALQIIQLAALAAGVSPLLGQVVLFTLISSFIALAAVPAFMLLRLNKTLDRPELESGPEFEQYLKLLAERLSKNPALARHPELIAELADAGNKPDKLDTAVRKALSILNAESDKLLRESAAVVFVATAISQSGKLDGLFVMIMQIRIIWRIAHIYNQRPSGIEIIRLYREVILAAFFAFGLNELMDTVGAYMTPIITELIGTSAIATIPGAGPGVTIISTCMMEGAANAFLTLRIGTIARHYSGSLARPQRNELRRTATREALTMLAATVKDCGSKIITRLGARFGAAGKTVVRKTCGTLAGFFGVGNKKTTPVSVQRQLPPAKFPESA